MNRFTRSISIALVLILNGCPGVIDATRFQQNAPPRCTAGIQVETQLFVQRCGSAGCHDTMATSGGLDLASPNVASRLVGIPSHACPSKLLVVPGDFRGGLLIEKLGAMPTCGSQMPLGGTALTPAEIDCVRAWIAQVSPPDGGTHGSIDAGAMDANATE